MRVMKSSRLIIYIILDDIQGGPIKYYHLFEMYTTRTYSKFLCADLSQKRQLDI